MKKLFITAIIAVLCVSAFGQLDIVKRDLTATRQITIRDTALYDFVKRHGGSITLTTTGTSGAATLIGGVLNIPQYSGSGSGEFPYTKTFDPDSVVDWMMNGGDLYAGSFFLFGNKATGIGTRFNPNESDASYAIYYNVFDTKYPVTRPSSQLLILRNDGTDVFKINKDGFISRPWGADVASASTITPTGPMFKVTGTTTINTINLPYTGFADEIKIVFKGSLTLGTSGNIAATTITPVIDRLYTLVYNPIDSKWYVSN